MARQLPRSTKAREFSLAGHIAFAAVVCLFIFVNTKAGTRGIGICMIGSALVQQFRGRIEYGWEGQPSAGHITGKVATFLNLALMAAGLGTIVWPEVPMQIFGWSNG